MNIYGNYKSPLGYQSGENYIDSYGVDHSGFSTRDEIEYQMARLAKENQIMQNFNKLGITKNYPQYGTNFWGNSDNNYGFGSSRIHDNIENKNNHSLENTMNTLGQSQTEQSYGLGNSNQKQNIWNRNQYQTSTPWAKQSSGFENNQPVQTKPVYENPNPRRYSTREILWDGVKGFGQGFVSGLESLANGVTLGGYDWLDNEYGLGAKERRQNLQQAADNAGVGQAFALANQTTELVGNGLGLYGIANIPSAARNTYNAYNIYKGTRNLENQLQRGNNFEDIYMGRIDRNKLNEINNIRQELGEPTISSEKVVIPKDRVEHIYNRRIVKYGYSPKDAAHTVSDALFNKNSQIYPSRYSTLQKIESPSANRVLVGKIRGGNNVFVKTGYHY